MKLKKILSIIGARPQFTKSAPLMKKLKENFNHVIVHTGQHYDRNMSGLFFKELNIPAPKYNLGIGSGFHGEQTGKMLIKIETILMKEKPDMVLIYGDTNSTAAGVLASVKLHIPTAHVEAGLRSFNKEMPEEHNRIVSDHLSDILFVPSKTGMKNLKNEGIEKKAFFVGDLMFDALLNNIEIAEQQSDILNKLNLIKSNYYLATVHRPSNTDNRNNLKNILSALSELDSIVVFPVHPRTKKFIKVHGLKWDKKKIFCIDPLGYLDTLLLTKYSKRVLTDSGGLQKEAFYLKKEVIVLREESEWIELVRSGWAKLAGADRKKIVNYAVKSYEKAPYFYPYGTGNTADKIIKILRRF